MKITYNYHTHMYLCKHAEGTIEDYVKVAIEKGLSIFGMSDHGPFIDELTDIKTRRMSMSEYEDIYLPELTRVKQTYGHLIDFKKAIEIEYLTPLIKQYDEFLKDLDYLILGQHLLEYQGKIYDVYSEMNLNLMELYKDTVVQAMSTGKFKILAHPELFNWCYRKWDEHCDRVSKEIIAAAIKYGVVLEINANGCRRAKVKTKDGEDTYVYPRLEFWREVAKTNALVMINDDAHELSFICDEATLEAYRFANQLGITLINQLSL
jgi:histidinol-phosphatase (PHP family)